jgi:hypothetical protein
MKKNPRKIDMNFTNLGIALWKGCNIDESLEMLIKKMTGMVKINIKHEAKQ